MKTQLKVGIKMATRTKRDVIVDVLIDAINNDKILPAYKAKVKDFTKAEVEHLCLAMMIHIESDNRIKVTKVRNPEKQSIVWECD